LKTAYRCNKHKRGLECTNNRGVPADLLEDFVRQSVHGKLNDERYTLHLLELTNRRAEAWNREHALKAGERASLEREQKKLQTVVERGCWIRSRKVSPSGTGSSSGRPS
jgi:hypothetical protein